MNFGELLTRIFNFFQRNDQNAALALAHNSMLSAAIAKDDNNESLRALCNRQRRPYRITA